MKIPRRDAEGFPKIVWDAHEYFPGMFDSGMELGGRLNDVLGQPDNVDAVVTVNSFIAARYVQDFPLIPQPAVVMNAAEWREKVEYDGRLHRTARLNPATKILLFQGYLHRFRGIEYLLEVAKHLREDWSLVFIGQGVLEDEIRQIATSEELARGNAKSVTLLPMVAESELHRWTAGASIGAIFYEPRTANQTLASPNKLWQYAASGVPTIAFAGPFLKQTIDDHQIGWVFDFETPPQKTAQLINSLTHEQLRFASNQSRSFARRFNSAGEERKLASLMKKLLMTDKVPE